MNFFRRIPSFLPRETLATITTPDRLIVAHVIEAITKDFRAFEYKGADKWSVIDGYKPRKKDYYCGYRDSPFSIISPSLKAIGLIKVYRMRPYGTADEKYWKREFIELSVNNVAIDPNHIEGLLNHYWKIRDDLAATEAAAARALAEMEANEAKWNLAEKLLGMKRVNGALVPVTSISPPPVVSEHSCDCDIGELCNSCGVEIDFMESSVNVKKGKK